MRRPNRRPNYMETGEIINWEETASYVIHKDGANIIAVNGNTGKEDYKDTDAHTVIQAAIDAATQGGIIFIKHGVYGISDTISIRAGELSLVGSGLGHTVLDRGTVLHLDDDVDKPVIEYYAPNGVNYFFAAIRDLYISANNAHQAAGDGIKVHAGGTGRANDLHLHGVMIFQAKEIGVHIDPGWGVHISHCLIEHSGGDGLAIKAGQSYISDVFTAYNDGNGIYNTGSGAMFSNLYAYENHKNGIYDSTTYSRFSNCISYKNNQDDATYAEFRLSGNYGSLSNSIAIGDTGLTARTGIELTSALYSTVTGCTTLNCTKELDIASNSSDCTVDGCTFKDGAIENEGIRCQVNGISPNAGVPGVAGDWETVTREGVIVRDTVNNKTYICADGGWREISAA